MRARQILSGSAWNLVGQAIPLASAVLAIPILDRELGTERYGLLLIAWMLVGYFGILDLGLGRALTHLAARQLAGGERDQVVSLTWTAVGITAIMGLCAGMLLAIFAPAFGAALHSMAGSVPQAELVTSLRVLAVGIPFVAGTGVLRGLLEALGRFDLVNQVRIPMGLLTYLGPVAVLPFSRSLPAALSILVAGRVVGWWVHVVMNRRKMPELSRIRVDPGHVRALFHFGGWMTVSNVVGPLMVYMDRLFIGAVLSASAVAYYATPWEILTKILLVPSALISTLFPLFSAQREKEAAPQAALYLRSIHSMTVVLAITVAGAVAVAELLLGNWLGSDYVDQSLVVYRLLAFGVLFNGLATLPYTLLQGRGRARLTAALHLLEFPAYAFGLYWATARWGIEGAAVVWTLRMFVDMVMLLHFSRREIGQPADYTARIASGIVWAVSMSLVALAPMSVAWRLVAIILMAGIHAAWIFPRHLRPRIVPR